MFVTFYANPNQYAQRYTDTQITFEEFLDRMYSNAPLDSLIVKDNPFTVTPKTITVIAAAYAVLNPRAYSLVNMAQKLREIYNEGTNLFNQPRAEMYTSFQIPKRTGGYRQIDAPKPELMQYLHKMKYIFEYDLKTLAHNAAYAYVKKRSCKDALVVHQQNNSKWFLKLDIKDFFPSCTPNFIYSQLKQSFPFHHLCVYQENTEILRALIDRCTLNNALPQGTPMSPLLTNLIMIPLDYTIQHELWDRKNNFCYTRYADDILISSPYTFSAEDIERQVQSIFERQETPFKIKHEKTRYGSIAGRNWNLGLMLNKDNQITIGHQKKEQLKAAVNNFARDCKAGVQWSKIDTQVLLGNLSYVQAIEPEYIIALIQKNNAKYEVDLMQKVKSILRTA